MLFGFVGGDQAKSNCLLIGAWRNNRDPQMAVILDNSVIDVNITKCTCYIDYSDMNAVFRPHEAIKID